VFFSDLSGFTALSEQLDPEDVQRIVTGIFENAARLVEKYGGRIDKFQGDAVMAVFGDPVVHEDDAERAVRAVLELHAAVDEMSPDVEQMIGRPIAMHTGINSGMVVTSGAEFDNAVGDAINVAARLESLSKPGEILIGPETAQLVEGMFDLVDHGTHVVKGKGEPVSVARVRGYARTRVEPSRREAKFVGRQEELGVLLGAVERLRDGESSALAIKAEAGAGKTRLLSEFRSRIPDEVQWLEGRAYAYGENIPYAMVIDLLSRALDIHEDDEPAQVEAKLHAACEILTAEPERSYPPLARLFGIPLPEGATLDRESYGRRLLESVMEMAESLAARGPTVLALQDLHWADASTVDLIKKLYAGLSNPVVMVANYRPEFTLELPDARELVLGQLSARQTGELIVSLMEEATPPQGLVEFIQARTDGNPFFVEEIVNSLVETGVLESHNGTWVMNGVPDDVGLPTSIRGVIGARIDRLDDRRRRVLREASVVGRDFLYEIVRRVATDDTDLKPSLDVLESADLIRKKTPDPDLEYLFKHALTQDVAYEGLLKSERQELHTRTAAAIESQFSGRLEEVTETLAFHWSRSGDLEKAVAALIAAGEKSMERFALTESQTHYRAAYEMLEQAPPSTARDRGIVDLLLSWAFLAYYEARFHHLGVLLRKHQDSVDQLGSVEEKGMWLAWLGWTYSVADGNQRLALSTLDEAISIGRTENLPWVVAYAQVWRVWPLLFQAQIDGARTAGEEALAICGDPNNDFYVWSKATFGLGIARALKGEFEQAMALAEELVTLGDASGNVRSQAMGHLIDVFLAAFALDRAWSDRAFARVKDADPLYEHVGAPFRAVILAMSDDLGPAREFVDDQRHRFIEDLEVKIVADLLEMIEALLKIGEGALVEGFTDLGAIGRDVPKLLRGCAEVFLALVYAEVAMADTGLMDAIRNLRFAILYGVKAKREVGSRLEHVLGELDNWGLSGLRLNLELAYARLLKHQGNETEATKHLEAGIAFIAPLGETAGLNTAREMLAGLKNP
jgi:class 3 adenylate cyclase/tetratricopeptide (TPR) repeat protein